MRFLFILLFFSTNLYAADIDKYIKTLEKVSKCKIFVTSGFRTHDENRRVGGVPNSYHLFDRARDFVPVDTNCISIEELGKLACTMTSTIIYPRHIHIDNRKNRICIKGRYK